MPFMKRPRVLTASSGVASLAVVSTLLLLITLGVLYLSQNLVSEQRAAAVVGNRVAAQEAAEAGLTWATQMLNKPEAVDASCTPAAAGSVKPFRQLYVQPSGSNTPLSPVKASPGCKLGAAGLRCSCPATGGTGSTASSASGSEAAFTVVFSAVFDAQGALVPDAVRVTATGCSAHDGACNPGVKAGASSGPDAVSHASVIVKPLALVRSRPAAPLTCAGNCTINSSVLVINRDTNTNGVLINAGGSISGCTRTTCLPLQGTPHPETLKAADSTLAAAQSQDSTCSGSVLFRRYFYQPLSDFAASPGVRTLTACADGASCGQQFTAALAQGYRAFVLPAGFVLDGSQGATVGSDSDPLVLVARGPVRISGGSTVHAMLFSNDANAGNLIIDNATVRGTVVSCGSVNLNRAATLEYAAQTMSTLVKFPSVFRRVAGSWTDLCTVAADGTVTCR